MNKTYFGPYINGSYFGLFGAPGCGLLGPFFSDCSFECMVTLGIGTSLFARSSRFLRPPRLKHALQADVGLGDS